MLQKQSQKTLVGSSSQVY